MRDSDETPPATAGTATRLHDLLFSALARRPEATDVVAVRDAAGYWSYAELTAHSRAVAGWLRRRGVAPGDRFVVHATPDRRLVAMLYGASLAGVTFVPLNPELRPFHLAHVLADADPAVTVTGDVSALSGAGTATTVDIDAMWAEVTAASPVAVPTERCGQRDERSERDDPPPALLIYTSGSTSVPKAVVCPHAQVVFAARAIASQLRYRPGDVVFCRLPFAFDYGLYQILLAAIATAELVVATPGTDARLLADIRQCGATVVPVVPSLATILAQLAARDRAPTSVRLFTNTGEALPPATIAALRQLFPGAGVALMFGITECKRISILEVDGDLIRPGSVGRPLPGTQIQIVDADSTRLPSGEVGEIVVRGDHVMAGYWRAPELTRRTFRRDPATGQPCLYTGDHGYLDADGYLYFVGRRDHIFKRRGLRTSTTEIEAAATDIPEVAEAAVVPPRNGRDAVLYLVTTAPLTDVLRQLHDRLEPGKIPGIHRLVPALPRGTTGKIDRAALAAADEKEWPT